MPMPDEGDAELAGIGPCVGDEIRNGVETGSSLLTTSTSGNTRQTRHRCDTGLEIIWQRSDRTDALIALAVLVSNHMYPSGSELITACVPIYAAGAGLVLHDNEGSDRVDDRRWQIRRDNTSVSLAAKCRERSSVPDETGRPYLRRRGRFEA